ncbi:MAG: hypothetical protein SFU25_01285 [Candidatus Caenarcaniphilales bacterium]|nr:hypothetical protein [Candidatus Caenarcaniphilales bacterium]
MSTNFTEQEIKAKDESITVFEAFKATFEYMKNYKEIIHSTSSGGVDTVLSWMSILKSDDLPADPAVWEDWLECVRKAKNNEVDIEFKLSNPNETQS